MSTNGLTVRVLVGDVRKRLNDIQPKSINTCVTSPPYFNLRTYLPDDHPDKDCEVGLEGSPEEFINELTSIFAQVKTVLRDDGTLFMNLGDSYAGSGKGRKADGTHSEGTAPTFQSNNRGSVHGKITKTTTPNCKPKDLIGIPWSAAFAFRDDGWTLRQEIIWKKPAAFPESVTDRFTKGHEHIFFMSKNRHYYFDSEAAKEPTADGAGLRNKRTVWEVGFSGFGGQHFATFPIELILPCVTTGCPENGWVFDPFGGSGTTAIAATRNGRNAVLCELNPEYIGVMLERLLAECPNGTEIVIDHGDRTEAHIVANTVTMGGKSKSIPVRKKPLGSDDFFVFL